MLNTNEVARIFDTILSAPGMNETVKINLKISRRNVLLLSSLIERGLTAKGDDKSFNILNTVPAETLSELKTFGDDCLQKAGLIELSEKLSVLSSSK